MTFRELNKLLRDNGWIPDSKGNGSSHIIYRKSEKSVPVPYHNGDIPKSTLNAILKQTGLK
ncbi:type II toxin-antitoxin system HicA family toxin [Breznakiellaceae bacterium SP9]